ncbi:MAG TPA: AAA family ATPase [Geobacteraceae bacterium]|nr:AAA family ATPase [Geobacteraceae bacterium]
MYWDYFGFREPPFSLTPNPDFLFLSGCHQEAYAHLLYAIETRAGFIELSGEVGTGKTTIIRTLLGELSPESYRSALIFNPTISPLGLLQEINREFGIFFASSETRELHQALNDFLLQENSTGRTVVLVIDEAQNLSTAVLEQVRLISNLETAKEKLIQIVLVGQPELRQLLAREELRQLSQRITVRYHLQPMESGDIHAYIRHRIKVAAAGREPVTFSAGAVKRIAAHSGGLPRLINGACDRALLLAYTMEVHEISPPMALQAIADLAKVEKPQRTRRILPAFAVLSVLCLAAATLLLYAGKGETPPGPPPAVAAEDRNGVKHLQEMLSMNGFYEGKPDGRFDGKTEEGVRRFQERERLQVDGRPGGQTLMRLYQKSGGIFPATTSARTISQEPR